MADTGDDEADLSEAFKKQLNGILVCLVCGPLHRFPSGKTHKSRSKHAMREMTPEERAEEIAWYREIQADGDAARMSLLEKRRRQARQANAEQAGVVEEPGPDLDGEYIFDFGKKKGKKLSVVWRKDKSYLGWIINSKMLDTYVTLKAAKEEAGILEDALALAAEMKIESARKVVAKAEVEKPEDLHPEVAQLRAIQVEEAMVVLGAEAPSVELEQVVPLPALRYRQGFRGRKRRGRGSSSARTLQHCWCCGSIDHKTVTCKFRPEAQRLAALERFYLEKAKQNNKKKAKIVSHLKYVNLRQRSAMYSERPAQRSQVPAKRSAKQLLQMDPCNFVKCCIGDKLIVDLEGHPCVRPACFRGGQGTPEASGTLGKLTALNYPASMDVSTRSVWHRCKKCGGKYSVTFGSMLFPKVGGNLVSLTDNVVAFWACVHDCSVTTCCKMLGLSEQVVRDFYATARRIMSADALRKQAAIVFGQLPDNKTCDFEPDEAQFFSWVDKTGEERVYYFWVWLGVAQRGAPDHLYLKERGITESRGEGRLPPLEPEYWRQVCSEIFNERSNMVQMSDSAVAYTTGPLPTGVVDRHFVNHSRKPHAEFARSVEALDDVVTKVTRPAIASTCLIDPTWRRLKAELPKGSVTAKTEAGRLNMTGYIRSGQWKLMLSTYDRWGPFCEAAAAYENELNALRCNIACRLHPGLAADATSKRLRRETRAAAPTSEQQLVLQGSVPDPRVPSPDELASQDPVLDPGDGLPEQQATPHSQPATEQKQESRLERESRSAWGSRFFEPQQEARCGQHALNNLLGFPYYDADSLEQACQTIIAETNEHPAFHRRPTGWYSHAVLARALDYTVPPVWRMLDRPASHVDWAAVSSEQSVAGMLCNTNNIHWTCISRHNDKVFYIDSRYSPVLIGETEFRRILDLHPFCFLVVRHDSDRF